MAKSNTNEPKNSPSNEQQGTIELEENNTPLTDIIPEQKDSSSPGNEQKETIETFLFRKEKETKIQVSPRLKRIFVSILAKNKNDYEKSWSELWA